MINQTPERIDDMEVAWEAAYAQKPFVEIALVAKAVGQTGVARDVESMGRQEVLRVEEVARAEGRMRQKLEREQAFSRLCRESEEDILTVIDFKLSNPKDGLEAWDYLRSLTEQRSDFPVWFVEYYENSQALLGDVAAAAELVGNPTVKSILQESALALAANQH